jgi:DNA-binding response OmpR family regulator
MPPKVLVVDDNQELLGLLTQLFEEAGYEVLAAARGRQALDVARGQPVRAAVLDVLLPDMMGYQLAEQLRKEHAGLPVVFITGVFKGGKHALDARTKYGAVAYFEKPFESSALLDAVKGVVPPQKPAPRAPAVPAAPAETFEVELDIDVEEAEPLDVMELTGRIKVTGGDNLTADLRGANLTANPMTAAQTALARTPSGHTPVPRPPPPPPRPPAPRTATVEAGAGGKSRKGELRDNLPNLFTAFYMLRETGELGVQRGQVKKVVYFEHGQPVFALSNLLADRFGQFLVRVGKVKPEAMADAVAASKAASRRTSDVLVERGLLKDTERLYFVGQQVKSIIYSLFAWEEGSYVMSFRDKARSESIKLDLHPAQLITRGIKKLYKPERLSRLVQPDERLIPSSQGVFQLHEVELEKWEAELLPRIDGNRPVSELQRLAGRPPHVVNGFLVGMLSLNILERRGAGGA